MGEGLEEGRMHAGVTGEEGTGGRIFSLHCLGHPTWLQHGTGRQGRQVDHSEHTHAVLFPQPAYIAWEKKSFGKEIYYLTAKQT